MRTTKSQSARLGELHDPRDHYRMVVGTMNDDGTMNRVVVTASTGRTRHSDVVSRRGRVVA